MLSYSGKRSVIEALSEYQLGGGVLSWTRAGKPDVEIRIDAIKDVCLVAAAGTTPFWQATVRDNTGDKIVLISMTYLGIGRMEDQTPEFAAFLAGLHSALADRPAGPLVFRTGSGVILGLWVLVLILLAMFGIFAVMGIIELLGKRDFVTAGVFILATLGIATWAPTSWKMFKENRRKPLDWSRLGH
ncbi:hypothetical protein BH11PSE2_BH11PSE2_11340 [soil metagenome]